MRHLRLYEEIDEKFKFEKGDYVKKIIPAGTIDTVYVIDWLFLQNQRKYYGIIFLTGEHAGEDAGLELESNLRKLEDYELTAIKYNI